MHSFSTWLSWHLITVNTESCSAGFSDCGGSLQRHDSFPPQCDPRGTFALLHSHLHYYLFHRFRPVRLASRLVGILGRYHDQISCLQRSEEHTSELQSQR